ncbi:hypothetical protein RRG08_032702 [Elysia crispata]|uniref:Uncharacterized protein n=1 Tax=Elysia crispata TaxID=231223 RepID=A0AAE0YUE5_9GAST|nr:hypothetical protein RRG08_032702 [Elysia crispata]
MYVIQPVNYVDTSIHKLWSEIKSVSTTDSQRATLPVSVSPVTLSHSLVGSVSSPAPASRRARRDQPQTFSPTSRHPATRTDCKLSPRHWN